MKVKVQDFTSFLVGALPEVEKLAFDPNKSLLEIPFALELGSFQDFEL